ncbi:DsbA family oxidoreductase [Lactobacillus sp. PV037]|uniref:DsbA family oxidoreductase n=1 Tax=unclassified Lactobacillus TaxID=2620435 RepID=UPI00223F9F5A|nr:MULTISPECIES: DsbA family oxidoreductase [unclassified Lactobacillus]QNQ81785.1 DsbA family oxidoreductase [Lactobacillus sp. PV012]QNQ84171.1 DsbA family oxidoreductase [Lactobacillus sp. PV037]
MEITVWSDYACPFCYIAEARIENLLNDMGVSDQVHFDRHAFQLYPDAPKDVTETTLDRFAAKYGLSKQEAAQRIEQISQMGRAEGLDFKYSSTLNTNTMDAHRLTQWVKDNYEGEVVDKLSELLFKAYFSENVKLADHAVLLKAAQEAGVDVAAAKKLLDSTDYHDKVVADEMFVQQNGVHAVPFFVIDGKGYMGAQPREVFEKAIKEGLEKEKTK